VATIHYLNVKEGDCSVILHNSGHATVVDVCNAKSPELIAEAVVAALAKTDRGISGNFQQKKYPVNPVSYLREQGIGSIFRYIQTHPDMDHMDGIKALFAEFSPLNLWDTENTKEMPSSAWKGSPYNEDDWKFYKEMRDTESASDPKRLALLSGARGKYYNIAEDGSGGGDGIYILAPTQELVDSGNEAAEDYHRCSYVLLYRTGGKPPKPSRAKPSLRLSDKQRWVMARLASEGKLTRCEVEKEFDISGRTAKRVLGELSEAGLIEFDRTTHPGFYRLI